MNVAKFVEEDKAPIMASFAVNIDAPVNPSFSLPAVTGGTIAVKLNDTEPIDSLLQVEFVTVNTYNILGIAEAICIFANNQFYSREFEFGVQLVNVVGQVETSRSFILLL